MGPQQPAQTINNIVVEQLRPDQLHAQWNWLLRGCLDILDKVAPHTEWIPEDAYAALAYGKAVCFMVSRNLKALGWVVGEIQHTRYGKTELFIWLAWDIPLREREQMDDVPGAREQLMDYLKLWAKSQGCSRISCLSSRHLEVLGWTKGHTTYYLPL